MNYTLVTGSTSGIGLAIAEALLNNDCYVFLNYYKYKIGSVEEYLPYRFCY